MAFLQNACPSPDILGRLTLPSDPSLRSPHSRQPAGSPQGLSLCWPQSPQTKPQTASPSRLPHTDAAAYGIHVQNPKASSSHQASHSVIPPLCPKEKMASRFPSLTHFFSVRLLLRSKSPPYTPSPPSSNPSSVRNKLPIWPSQGPPTWLHLFVHCKFQERGNLDCRQRRSSIITLNLKKPIVIGQSGR